MQTHQMNERIHMNVGTLQEMRVELLRDCPLLCAHCSAYAAPNHTMKLPLQRVLELVDEFADGNGRRVTFTGGEPLMYPGIEAVLQRSRDHGLQTRLFSSGIVFAGRKRVAGGDILARCSTLLDTVMYSVYSSASEAHDRVTRIPGSLALTLEAIQRTKALDIEAELHFVPTRINYLDFPAVVELALSLGVSKVGVLRFVPQGRGKAHAEDLALDKEAHLWLQQRIREIRKRSQQIHISAGSAYNLLQVDAPLPCKAAIDQIVIEANGNIVPCSAFSNVHVKDGYGNILHHPLHVVWQQSLYLQQVRQALATPHDCRSCLAQKTIASGYIDIHGHDPLEEIVA